MALPLPLPDPGQHSRVDGAANADPVGPMTPDEYDAFEAESEVRHEYVDVPREPPPLPQLRRVREPDAEYEVDGVPEYAD